MGFWGFGVYSANLIDTISDIVHREKGPLVPVLSRRKVQDGSGIEYYTVAWAVAEDSDDDTIEK